MDKRKLTRELMTLTGGAIMISPHKLKAFLSTGTNEVANLLQGLEFIQTGKNRKFFVADVAERLMERCDR